MGKKVFKTISNANHKQFELPYLLLSYTKFDISSIIRIRILMFEIIVINNFGTRTGVEISLKTFFPTIIEGKIGFSIF